MQHITGNILCIGLLAENKDRTVMLIVFDKVFADFDCLAEHYRKYARRLRVKSSAVTGFFDAADALCHVVESASPKELSVCGQEDNQSPVAKAFCALRGLACSHDEYVWETASQAVSAVLHHLHHE